MHSVFLGHLTRHNSLIISHKSKGGAPRGSTLVTKWKAMTICNLKKKIKNSTF
jgi:hypothetical protein